MLKPGFLIDRKYRIEKLLGSGNFGDVYLAVNIRSGRKWAVKEIRKSKEEGKRIHEIFHNEIEALKKLEHKNIANISDFYEFEESCLIFTDYIDGATLDRFESMYREKSGNGIPLQMVYKISMELCSAICFLQEHYVIHGDIKPTNIMITKELHPILIDFGGAFFARKEENRKLKIHTPGFSPPEAGSGEGDLSTDVFSFGAVLKSMLSASSGKDRFIRDHLNSVCLQCMQTDPAKRYKNAAELYEDLKKIHIGSTRTKKESGRFRWMVCLAMILIPLFGGISVYGGNMKTTMKNKAYSSCLAEAGRCVREEAAQYYRMAIMLEPGRKEGYLGLIDVLSSDNELSAEDDALLTDSMKAVEYDRSFSNEDWLRSNQKDYLDVAYRFGITYYYCFDDLRKTAALKYLSDVAGTQPESEDGLSSEEHKRISDTLVRMIRYGNQLGQPDRRGENEITYMAYWQDMKNLLRDDLSGEQWNLMVLWISEDVLSRILNDAVHFMEEGITAEELENVTEEIEEKVKYMDIPDGIQSGKLKEEILRLSPLVRAKLAAESAKAMVLPGGADD